MVATAEAADRELPRSAARAALAVLALALALSDVPRAGPGISRLSAGLPAAGAPAFQSLQPGAFVFSGPGNSSYAALARETAAAARPRVWVYKLDAMSLSWRAFARRFPSTAGRAFPRCLLSERESCAPDGGPDDAATLGGDQVFAMMDALAGALARGGVRASARAGEPAETRLRTRSTWADRAHHLLLPQLFADELWRVHQALHYPPAALRAHLAAEQRPGALCFGLARARPLVCGELFANYRRACRASDARCAAVGLLLQDVLRRARELQARFPALAVDLTLMDSQDDAQQTRGGLAAVSFRRGELTSILRARNCSAAGGQGAGEDACETAFVVERRYACARVESDADEWFVLAAALRVASQLYVGVRALLLLAGCARWARGPRALGTALRLLARTPVQCVVYGSALPVLGYALAHLVDAPATYLLLHGAFLSNGGLNQVQLARFLPLAVLQMRSVWLFAAVLLLAVALASLRRGRGAHRPLRGVRGAPEYALGALACATVAAQYRRASFRSVALLDVFDLGAAGGQRLAAVKYQHAPMNAQRGAGARQLGGVLIDLKFLVAALLLLLAAWVAANLAVAGLNALVRWRWRRKTACATAAPPDSALFRPWRLGARTPVSYAAGELWPPLALAVHWPGDCYCQPRAIEGPSAAAVAPTTAGPTVRALRPRAASRCGRLRPRLEVPTSVMGPREFDALQTRLARVAQRDQRDAVSVAFMNLVVMTDPLVLLLATRLAPVRLGYYAAPGKDAEPLLLPRAAADREDDERGPLELLTKTTAAELRWEELLRCG